MARLLPSALGRRWVLALAGLTTGTARYPDRRRGVAIWASQMAASAPRRFCQSLRFTDWQDLASRRQRAVGQQGVPRQLVLTVDSMWPVSVCALALFHRPVALVVSATRRDEVEDLPCHGALYQRWRWLDGAEGTDGRSVGTDQPFEQDETVVWVLGSDDLTLLAGQDAEATGPAWAQMAAEGTVEVLWLRSQLESDAVSRCIVETMVSASAPTTVREWVDLAAAHLQRQLEMDPLALPQGFVATSRRSTGGAHCSMC